VFGSQSKNHWYLAYCTFGLTWLVLTYVDWQVPGFVSFNLPSYWLLLMTVICGLFSLGLGYVSETSRRATLRTYYGVILAGALLGGVVVLEFDSFGAYRIFIGLLMPLAIGLAVAALNNLDTNSPNE
jgi:hypothetical protein